MPLAVCRGAGILPRASWRACRRARGDEVTVDVARGAPESVRRSARQSLVDIGRPGGAWRAASLEPRCAASRGPGVVQALG
eukprot:3206030-Alexandrium_andersonii.AAC.1